MNNRILLLFISLAGFVSCQPKESPEISSVAPRPCEFGVTDINHGSTFGIDPTASELGLNKNIGYGKPLHPPECWSFANGVIFFTRALSVSSWAYGGWWDGDKWVNPYGAVSMSLPSGSPVMGEALFRQQRYQFCTLSYECQFEEDQNIPLSQAPDTIIPLPNDVTIAVEGDVREIQMPPALPYPGKHRLLFPGGAYEVEVQGGNQVPLIDIRPPSNLLIAPNDTTVDTVSIRFSTAKPDSVGFGIPFRRVTRIKSIRLFIELIDPDPTIPKPYWRFVESDTEVRLPSKSSWLVRGTCIQPLWVNADTHAGKEFNLEWQTAMVQLPKKRNDELLSFLAKNITSPAELNTPLDSAILGHLTDVFAGENIVDDTRIIPCDAGVEIENGTFVADFDRHVGGYLFSTPVSHYYPWAPPIGWETDRSSWSLPTQ